jgi:uncharacterized phage protein gp47/JayE
VATTIDEQTFIPLYATETEETILARMRDWANEGLDPDVDVDQWVDTRVGSMWYLATMPTVRELARLYDSAGTELIAVAFPLWSWGQWLDDHAEGRGVQRNAATPAEGSVTFTGEPGTPIEAGITVYVPPPTEQSDQITFEVTETGEIGLGGTVELPIIARESGALGNVAIGAITEVETVVDGLVSVANDEPTKGGADVESDESLREKVLATFEVRANGNEADYRTRPRAFDGVGRVAVVPLAYGPGTVVVILSTPEGGPVSGSTVAAVQNFLDPPHWSGTVNGPLTLPVATIPVNEPTDLARASGALIVGNQIVTYTGKTSNSFTGVSGGTGSIASGTRVQQGGKGAGTAPIGHHVLVLTATIFTANVEATVELETGYSLDGDDGRIGVRTAIRTAIREYVESIPPGGEIVISQLIGRIVSIDGVHDVPPASVKINGVAANAAVPTSPPQVPALGTTTLTAA